MRRAPTVLILAGTLALAGCGDADVELPGTGPDAVPESPAATAEAAVPGADATSSPGSAPASGECVSLPTDEDGEYAVGDAGSATVRLEGERLVLGEVTAAEGWEHSVSTEEDTEVEIEFTGDDGQLDLRVEIEDDGLPQAELCADD